MPSIDNFAIGNGESTTNRVVSRNKKIEEDSRFSVAEDREHYSIFGYYTVCA